MSLRRIVCRLLMVVSLSLYAISIFQPWAVERYFNIWLPEEWSFQFWSFQAVRGVVPDGNLSVFRFLEYWTPQTDGWHPYAYQGWLWFSVFVFQMIGVVAGAASIVREKVRDDSLVPIYSTTCLILTLIFSYFQFVRQLELQREHFDPLGITGSSINFDIGFHLALIAVILSIISLSFDQIACMMMEDKSRYQPSQQRLGVETQTKYPQVLFAKYALQYPHNPEGVLEWHIHKKTKEGKTREQAIKELMQA